MKREQSSCPPALVVSRRDASAILRVGLYDFKVNAFRLAANSGKSASVDAVSFRAMNSKVSSPRGSLTARPAMRGDKKMLDFALAYARRGRRVFPVYEPSGSSCACGNRQCQKPAKHPRTRRGFLEATVDEEVIREWYTRWPRANIGIATEPSRLVVLDVDPRHGGDESLHLLSSKHSAFDAPVVLTRRGGSHHYFAASIATATRPNALVKIIPGIDVCARHRNIIVPPSRHISGRVYRWEVSSPSELMGVPRVASRPLGPAPKNSHPRNR